MKIKTFFEKFDQFAEAPNAVAKLRELVLQLAICGKLVEPPKLAESNPAWAAFQKERSKQGLRNNPKYPQPFHIPAHWAWCGLDEASDCRSATKVTPTSIRENDWILDLEDIDGTAGKVIKRAIFSERQSLSTKASFKIGDVLYGKLRPYLNKVVIADKAGFCTTEIIPLRPKDFLLAGYLRTFLRSPYFLQYAATKNYGMKMPRLGTKDLESAAIAIPPPAEQKRIVTKVDELMAVCDRLEAQLKERETRQAELARAALARFADVPAPANLNFLFHPSYAIAPADIRKTILTLAVQGELLETCKELKDRPLVAMRDICLQITDGEHATPQRIANGVPLATAKNVRDGFLDLTTTDWVAPATAEKCWKRCKPQHNDLLMVCVGATTGRVCLVQNPLDIVLVRSVALIRPNPDRIAPSYLNLFLRSPDGQSQIWGNVKQSAQPCLYLGKMSDFQIALPPLAEQRRIVAKVDQLMTLVDQLEAQLATSRATAGKLMDAAVAELNSQ